MQVGKVGPVSGHVFRMGRVDAATRSTRPGGLGGAEARDTEAVASALPRLEVPAALVWGVADRFQKLDPYGRRLAADLGASLDEVQGAKHFTPEDHPERVAAAIKRVLAALAAT